MTLKTKCYHSCGCCDDSSSCEQLNKRVADEYFEKKVRLWSLITFLEIYSTITKPEWLVSTWRIFLTDILEEKHLKLTASNQIWGPLSALKHFGFLWTPAAKVLRIQELVGSHRLRLSTDAQNRACCWLFIQNQILFFLLNRQILKQIFMLLIVYMLLQWDW